MLKDSKISSLSIFLFTIEFFILPTIAAAHAQVERPRGVSLSRKPLYPRQDIFTCIDGSKRIKYSQINDDYCDCQDGSDEPGTSACPNGFFHCTNTGHRPKNIPSSRVNDGICDCCDSSDEFNSNAKCINNCLELGRAERQKEKSRQELLKKGVQLRADLATQGSTRKIERETRLAELEKRKADAEAIKQEKENIKKEIESYENEALDVYRQMQEEDKRVKEDKEAQETKREAEDTFERYDSNKDGYIDKVEIQTRIVFDRNRDGAVDDEEARFFLDESDRVTKDQFVTTCWSRIKPRLMLDSGLFEPPQREEPKEPEQKAKEDETELLNQEEEHVDEDEGAEEDDTGEGEVEEQQQNTQPEYDPETQKLIEQANLARTDYEDAIKAVSEIEEEIREINDQNSKDYGEEQEYATLDGECFSYEDREYVYNLCPFDKTSQQPRSGGGETRLGKWDRWDGKSYKYSHMLYSNGASCWNGPQRSLLVKIECGLENRITSVTEPNRCEYHMSFETPAACINMKEEPSEDDEEIHDEL